MKIFDAHIHFIHPYSAAELSRIFDRLEKFGLEGFDALVFVEFPSDMNTALKMIPGDYHPFFTPEAVESMRNFSLVFGQSNRLKIMPYVDARFIDHDIEQKMRWFRQKGFEGLKLLYVPERDGDYQIGGMEEAFGRPLQRSEEITSTLIESAASQGMRVLFHADLRKYGAFVEDMVRSYPQINFNIPHFGYSRRAISHLLDTYPNCYTDLSYLSLLMERERLSYLKFIKRYPDRILFGSDAVIGQPEQIQSALEFVKRFLDDEELFFKLVNRNYLRFHGLSKEALISGARNEQQGG